MRAQTSINIFDSLYRITEVRTADKVLHYTYDDAGNRNGMTVEILVASPGISSLGPHGAVAGSSGFVLRILGSNFTNTSVVQWNGSNRTTIFVSANELQISVLPADISSAGTASVVVVNSTATFSPSNAQTFSIVQAAALTGRVTASGGVGLPNVLVNLTGTESDSALSDNNGNFAFAVLSNGNYTVTPTLANYTFSPPNRLVSFAGITQSNLDFTAIPSQSTATISGRVFTATGTGLKSALVSVVDSTGAKQTALTNSFGIYTLNGIRVGENYILTVSSKSFRFAAKSVQVNGNLANVDFVGVE